MAPAKKAPAKKAPAKKAAAKKAPAKKAAAKKAPAKKAAAKKAPAKKAAGQEGCRQEGSRQEGCSEEGSGQEGCRQEGSRQEGCGQEGSRQEGCCPQEVIDAPRRSVRRGALRAPRSRLGVAWLGHNAGMELICDDLVDEHASLERPGADSPRPSGTRRHRRRGWTVRDQVSHIWFFDQRALLALTDPDGVRGGCAGVDGRRAAPMRRSSRVGRSAAPRCSTVGAAIAQICCVTPRDGRSVGAGAVVRPGDGCPIVHHGTADGDVGARPGRRRRARRSTATPTERLRHVAHIGVRARPFSYANSQV